MTHPLLTSLSLTAPPFDSIVVFDLETTGLSPRWNEIIQIGAVRIVAGTIREDDAFFSYVKPSEPIPPFITSYTGITEADVAGAPTAKHALPQFSRFCGDSLLVAHNGLSFDIAFIRESCDRHGLRTRNVNFVDSMHLSWHVWGRRQVSHSLSSVQERLKVTTGGLRRHDVRGDVHITANCVCKMVHALVRTKQEVAVKLYSRPFPQMAKL
jgi:DNA polymerase III alpha subunit (gram-positive type)